VGKIIQRSIDLIHHLEYLPIKIHEVVVICNCMCVSVFICVSSIVSMLLLANKCTPYKLWISGTLWAHDVFWWWLMILSGPNYQQRTNVCIRWVLFI